MSNTLFKTVISLVVFVLTIFSAPLFSLNAEDKKPLPIHYSGRVVIGELDNHPTYTYSWPGVYFEAAFVGTAVDIKLNDSNNILNIIVDGRAPKNDRKNSAEILTNYINANPELWDWR